jgi:glycyl-tRNA synthetase alpha subunit
MAEETEPPSAPTTVRVITETRNLRSPPFIAPEEPCATGNAWEEWLEGIEREFRYFKITDPVDKKDALIIYGGKQVAKLEKSLPNPESGNPYEKLRTKLNNHYLPKKNKHYARYQFLKLRPNPGESTSSYAARLREKATDCEFVDTHDDRILEHIIQTLENKTLIHKSINKAWDLTQFLIEAAQMENIKQSD